MENIDPSIITAFREAGLGITLVICGCILLWRSIPMFFEYLRERNNVDRVQAETAKEIISALANTLDEYTGAMRDLRDEITANCAGMKAELQAIKQRLPKG